MQSDEECAEECRDDSCAKVQMCEVDKERLKVLTLDVRVDWEAQRKSEKSGDGPTVEQVCYRFVSDLPLRKMSNFINFSLKLFKTNFWSQKILRPLVNEPHGENIFVGIHRREGEGCWCRTENANLFSDQISVDQKCVPDRLISSVLLIKQLWWTIEKILELFSISKHFLPAVSRTRNIVVKACAVRSFLLVKPHRRIKTQSFGDNEVCNTI